MPHLSNPYRALPATSFWRKCVSTATPEGIDFDVPFPFGIRSGDPVATAGSCFAQHISKRLVSRGFRFLQEELPVDAEGPAFSARYGNVYTTRQLRQLFDRAYGLFAPRDRWLRRSSGAYVDPFRPQIFPDGFASVDALLDERDRHLAAVRRVFENCAVFVFTLGLTETWLSEIDGAAFPVCLGTVAVESEASAGVFANLTVDEMVDDLRTTIAGLREVNPDVRLILTVSPVPLVASYVPKHVLLSNTYSKAALRVVADTIARSEPGVAYFPSYEIIAGPQARSAFYDEDLRSVLPGGVDAVMRVFERRFLDQDADTPVAAANGAAARAIVRKPAPELAPSRAKRARRPSVVDPTEFVRMICDEEALEDEQR